MRWKLIRVYKRRCDRCGKKSKLWYGTKYYNENLCFKCYNDREAGV